MFLNKIRDPKKQQLSQISSKQNLNISSRVSLSPSCAADTTDAADDTIQSGYNQLKKGKNTLSDSMRKLQISGSVRSPA